MFGNGRPIENFFLCVFVAILLLTPLAGAQNFNPSKPNIVLFYSDDQSWDDLGCFGNEEVKTPNIDRLAEEGVKLTQFYAASSVCTPARSALLTGRYPHRNGLFENIRNNQANYKHEFTELEYTISPEMTLGLDLREVTIGEALQDAGYRTGIFGKWDSGRAHRFLPLQRGFDAFYGFCNTGIDYYTHERYGVPSMFRGNQRVKEKGYATDLFNREAVRFIDKHHDEPFFLYVPFNAPHGASNHDVKGAQAPDEYVKMYSHLSDDRRARFYAAITCMDDAIGEILAALDLHGLTENSLVIFTTDHGGRSGVLRGRKGNMYEGGLRTPFVARWPAQIQAGTTNDAVCSAMDFFPTFLEAAGAPLPDDIHLDGKSLLPVLTGETNSHHKELFWELRGQRGARVGDWKWVVDIPDRWVLPDDTTGKLFNLKEDPGEQNNLADAEPEALARCQSRWDAWMKEMVESEERGPYSKAYFDKLGYGLGNYRLVDE